LAARGCQQKANAIDFKEVFSPVLETTSVRSLLAIAAQNDCWGVGFLADQPTRPTARIAG